MLMSEILKKWTENRRLLGHFVFFYLYFCQFLSYYCISALKSFCVVKYGYGNLNLIKITIKKAKSNQFWLCISPRQSMLCSPCYIPPWVDPYTQQTVHNRWKTTRLKKVCHEIFDLHFLWFEPIQAPDKQAKVFSYLVSILSRYSITEFEKFDAAVCMTPRSQNFQLS